MIDCDRSALKADQSHVFSACVSGEANKAGRHGASRTVGILRRAQRSHE